MIEAADKVCHRLGLKPIYTGNTQYRIHNVSYWEYQYDFRVNINILGNMYGSLRTRCCGPMDKARD